MDIKIGDKVKYLFPSPMVAEKSFFVGIVDFIGDTFVTLRNEQNICLKVSFKNFHLIKPSDSFFENLSFVSENYLG